MPEVVGGPIREFQPVLESIATRCSKHRSTLKSEVTDRSPPGQALDCGVDRPSMSRRCRPSKYRYDRDSLRGSEATLKRNGNVQPGDSPGTLHVHRTWPHSPQPGHFSRTCRDPGELAQNLRLHMEALTLLPHPMEAHRGRILLAAATAGADSGVGGAWRVAAEISANESPAGGDD